MACTSGWEGAGPRNKGMTVSIEVTFWGVRGSIAVPGVDFSRYGGNTSCVEVVVGGERIIFDAGTGLRVLGLKMLREKSVLPCTLALSHTHWDHISGFPFFQPAFNPNHAFHIVAGHLDKGMSIESVLAGQMAHPFFPVPLGVMAAKLTFEDFTAGEDCTTITGRKLKTLPLNHPDRATAYRVEENGHAVCYVTDTEHRPGEIDQSIVDFVRGADLVIYDASYNEEEMDRFRGWGHSSWQEGIRIARAAGARQLALFHHYHERTDTQLDEIGAAAQSAWEGAFVSREGMTLTFG